MNHDGSQPYNVVLSYGHCIITKDVCNYFNDTPDKNIYPPSCPLLHASDLAEPFW
jgi:hypothetical protein